LGTDKCPRQINCPVNKKLDALQDTMDTYLASVTFGELIDSRDVKKVQNKKRKGRKDG
jgi:DNA-binding IscR family transcriptional regulator